METLEQLHYVLLAILAFLIVANAILFAVNLYLDKRCKELYKRIERKSK